MTSDRVMRIERHELGLLAAASFIGPTASIVERIMRIRAHM